MIGKLSRGFGYLVQLRIFDSDVVDGADIMDVDEVSILLQCGFFSDRLLNDADDIFDRIDFYIFA